MRRIRCAVAMSLDGYIAGPNGEFDWIIMDPAIDFQAVFTQFDTILMGRHTFEGTAGQGGGGGMPAMRVLVFSRTLRQADHPGVTIVSDNAAEVIAAERSAAGKDIWLFGGGDLFRSLSAAGHVDTLEVAVIPILLGGGVSLFPPPASRIGLKLTNHRIYKTGIVSLEYNLSPAAPPAASKSPAKKRRR